MSGIVNSTGAVSGIIGTTVAPAVAGSVAGTGFFLALFDTGNVWVNASTGTKVPFDLEFADDDGLYDHDGDHDYTAPATGVYLFCATMFVGNSDLNNGFEFRINNARLVSPGDGNTEIMGVYHEGNSSNRTLKMVQALKLTSGQVVTVNAYTGSNYYQGQSHWWGYRLK